MKRVYATALVLVFLFVFVFALAATVAAEGRVVGECCTYTNDCGHTGYGVWEKDTQWTCNCRYNNLYQGWYEGCLYACPAACVYP